MQTVIVIKEENHNLIGVAKTYADAVDFLIKKNWLDEYCELYDSDNGSIKTIKEDLGKKWKEIILSWDVETFNEYFDCLFYLRVEEVYRAE